MLHKKILYVYMSGVCHWDTYNNISQYANILKAKLSPHLIWKNCTESKISPLALRSSTRRASSSSDINFENKLNETEEEAFHEEQETSLYPQHHHIAFQDTQISNISYSLFSSIPMQERHSCFEIFRSESWSQYLDTECFWFHLYINVEKHLARVF